MKLRTLALAALLCACFAATVAAEPPAARQLTAAETERLAAGKKIVRVTSGDTNRAEVVGVVDAPPEAVWRVIADYDAYEAWFPDQEEARVLSREGEMVTLEGTVSMPFPFADRSFRIRDRQLTRQVEGQTHYYDSWTYVKDSGNIEDTTGFWYVSPFQGDVNRSVVRLVILADFGVPLPDFVISWGTRRSLPRIIDRLRERAAPAVARP